MCERTGNGFGICDVAYIHVIVYVEVVGDDFYSVELIADDATADGVSVQTDETVVESPPVADHDVFFTIARAELRVLRISSEK